MSHFWNILYVVGAMVLLFGAAVFVHEFGHFWMARRRGMKVEAFAIGFGPKIVSWKRDGIEYSWRWIPAGGFVKLPQMITSDALEGRSGDEHIPPAAPFSKILVAFAGPFMNVVFAFAIATLIYFVGLPVPVNPSIVGHVEPDSDEAKLGIQAGDRIVAVNGEKVKSWQDVFQATALARTNVLPVAIDRSGLIHTYQLKTTTDNPLGLKMLNLESKDHVVIGSVERGSAADAAHLQPGDEIVKFGGVPIVAREQLSEIVNKHADQLSPIVIHRGNETLSLNVTPKLDPQHHRARIGIVFATKYEVQKPGPSPWAQITEVWNKTFRTLGALFHSKETGVGVKDLSGPPGILAMLAAQINTDFRLALSFLVLLNINLAVLNLLPIPVLDGGHILMAVIEKIWRRPLSVRFVEYTTTAFALALITFMLYVSFNDVTQRYSLFKSMFQGKAHIEEHSSSPSTNSLP